MHTAMDQNSLSNRVWGQSFLDIVYTLSPFREYTFTGVVVWGFRSCSLAVAQSLVQFWLLSEGYLVESCLWFGFSQANHSVNQALRWSKVMKHSVNNNSLLASHGSLFSPFEVPVALLPTVQAFCGPASLGIVVTFERNILLKLISNCNRSVAEINL